MIQLSGIEKRYGQLQVLRGVDLDINRGEVLAICGPSGAGKTTLLKIMGTLDRADAGKVLYDGQDVMALNDTKLSAFRNSNIGFVFQFHQLLSEFTVIENVALPAMIAGASYRDAVARAMPLISYLG
ncbi:MAG: ATP-binding cassette domain-containing protein, partial [Muribaculum sp.]|nr:ATP-binding cassette domain-containing protein [Muribaculum sp.]